MMYYKLKIIDCIKSNMTLTTTMTPQIIKSPPLPGNKSIRQALSP